MMIKTQVSRIIQWFCLYFTANDNSEAYRLNSSIRSLLIDRAQTQNSLPFSNISTPDHMWSWLESDLSLFVFTGAAGNLGSSVIIGNATRFRQVR